MSIQNRDVTADYVAAYRAEYEVYKSHGMDQKAEMVAEALRDMGYAIRPKPSPGLKERAVDPEPFSRAVETVSPKRRGRPPKAAV